MAEDVSQTTEHALLTIEETMKKLRVGRSKLYRMMEPENQEQTENQ